MTFISIRSFEKEIVLINSLAIPICLFICYIVISFLLVVMIWFMVFNATFSYIVAVSFIGGGNWCTLRKPMFCRKSLTNFIP